MPRSLVSYWKRVATSGPTADGREILPQELRDIAETYKVSTYTAVIWCEHERWCGSHGTVFAVRLVEDADDLQPGQIALEAQLKPNDKLLRLNDQGEKLFTSIEITPNFGLSGKAYLTGLAVTDSPASLGTQELYFSSKSSKAAFFAMPVALGSLREDLPHNDPEGLLASMFAKIFKRFAVDEQEASTSTDTPTESKPPMDEATAKALKALNEQLAVIVAGIAAVIAPATDEVVDPVVDEVDDVQAAVDAIVTQVETDRDFSRQSKTTAALLKGMAEMQKQFSALVNTPKGRDLQVTTGANDNKKRVL
ncbi:GPO family capsid scaffolding protein [Pseudomonas sp. NPDC087358]|uniref:GPO family capsid scaffolding protein n=1 Tax=Pseudomonas sp. NPDC087358 TaxID=3364439 RepID=UPI00384FDE20